MHSRKHDKPHRTTHALTRSLIAHALVPKTKSRFGNFMLSLPAAARAVLPMRLEFLPAAATAVLAPATAAVAAAVEEAAAADEAAGIAAVVSPKAAGGCKHRPLADVQAPTLTGRV
jgi:hypothetical protein